MVLKILRKLQAVLRILLPSPCFKVVNRLASYLHTASGKMLAEIKLIITCIYYVITRNTEQLNRIKTIYSVKPYSMVGIAGLLATYDITMSIERDRIEGSFVECGVAKGGCSALMAIVASRHKSGRKTWLFDSFEGLPEPTKEDPDPEECVLKEGSCLAAYDEVEMLLFSRLGLDKDNVLMVKGWFQDTLAESRGKVGSISLLRLDADWYESTKCCLENLYDDVVGGGYIVIDDYGCLVGCKKAVDDFLRDNNVDVTLIPINADIYYFIKPSN